MKKSKIGKRKSSRIKQRNIKWHIILLGFSFIICAISVTWVARQQNKPLEYARTPGLVPYPTSTPTPGSLSFVPFDGNEKVTSAYHIPLTNFATSEFKKIRCLDNSDGYIDAKRLPKNDQRLDKILDYLNTYKFSDEERYFDTMENEEIVMHEGESSTREITLLSICEFDAVTIVMGDANKVYKQSFLSSKVYAAGGGPSPSFLGYFSDTGNRIFTRDQLSANPIMIGDWNVQMTAYFGCGRLFGVAGNEIFYGCGGGDGCCSASGVFTLNLKTEIAKNLVVCGNAMNGDDIHTTSCYNQKKEQYFSKTNEL